MTPPTMRFSPLRHDGTLALERQWTLLIVNGARQDLAARDDDTPETDWVQAVRVTDLGLEATVLLPHGPEAPEGMRFPRPEVVETAGPQEEIAARQAKPRHAPASLV